MPWLRSMWFPVSSVEENAKVSEMKRTGGKGSMIEGRVGAIRVVAVEALRKGPSKYIVLITRKKGIVAIMSRDGYIYPMTYCFNDLKSAKAFAESVVTCFGEKYTCAIYELREEGE